MNHRQPEETERRLLAVYAHPDDETFGTGGTLALYARRGVKVYLVCATRGEVGEAPAGLKGFGSKAEMRESELRCAAGILGLSRVTFLDYRDSGMPGSPDNRNPSALAAAPLTEVAHKVARSIREIRPQVVLTFDPIGGYRHPDHIAIHNATVAAVQIAGDPREVMDDLAPYAPERLYFSTFSRRFLRLAVRVLRFAGRDPSRFGQNHDIDLAGLCDVDFPIHASISIRPVIRVKAEASACHSSQGGRTGGRLTWLQALMGGSETYMRALPSEPPPRLEHDLFASQE